MNATIVGALIQVAGSIIVAVILIFWYYRHERWKLRHLVVATLWGTRGAFAERPSLHVEKDFERNLNAVPVLWSSDSDVMKLWREVQFVKASGTEKIPDLLALLARKVGWKDAEASYVKSVLTFGDVRESPPAGRP